MDQEQLLYHLQGAKDGHEPSERALYEGYVPFVYNLVKRYVGDEDDAADIAQETMITVFRKLKNYDPLKGTFKSWIGKIAIRKSLQHNNLSSHLVPLEDWFQLAQTLHFAQHEPHQPSEDSAFMDHVQLAVSRLNENQQNLFKLFFELELSHAEIAHLLNITTSNSRVRVHRLIQDLKKLL